jgi:hypothetical protein
VRSVRPIDPSRVYARLMSGWLESARTGAFPLSWSSERSDPLEDIFQEMWAAYEHWIIRGVVQYSLVAIELARFYGYVRRIAMKHRHQGSDRTAEKAEIIRAATAYLTSVREIGESGLENFKKDVDDVLKRLSALAE